MRISRKPVVPYHLVLISLALDHPFRKRNWAGAETSLDPVYGNCVFYICARIITGYGSTLYIGIDMVFCIPPIH